MVVKLTLVDKKEVAKGTKSFIFETEKEISWLPGQFYYFTLPKLTHDDPKGATRHFTIHLSPTEGKNIGFTTRMRADSGYKQSLDELEMGATLTGAGPEGTFILDEHEKGEHVILCGGIGITPFRSIIKYNVDRGLTDTKIHLIYANSAPDEIAFRDELEAWAEKSPNIDLHLTVSKPDKTWKGNVGRIDEEMVKKIIVNCKLNIENCTWWICGPPPMVTAMEKLASDLKIPSGKVRTEKFTGY